MASDITENARSNFIFIQSDWTEIITLSRKLTLPERTVLIDTMYLIQLRNEEFEALLLDPKYHDSQKNPSKKAMAGIFRSLIERKIDACFSNNIMREFVGRMPKKANLLEIYKRYFVVITPKEKFETNIFDLASAINSCMNQYSDDGCGDIKDSYSYLLAVLAKVGFFVTEDKHLDMIYRYLGLIRKKDVMEKNQEILKIKAIYESINGENDSKFPILEILQYLFSDTSFLTVPVSLLELKNNLPEVLDKYDSILWIMRSVGEIEWLKTIVGKLPQELDHNVLTEAKKRIAEVSQSVGFKNEDEIDEYTFKSRIIEKESDWFVRPTDEDLGYSLDSQLSILHEALFREEAEDQKEYADLEEYYFDKEDPKTFKVKCQNCSSEFELETCYMGVTETYERNMGTESFHEWTSEDTCPNCDNEVTIHHEVFEYPLFIEEDEETECTGCDLLPEKAPEKPPSTTLQDFM